MCLWQQLLRSHCHSLSHLLSPRKWETLNSEQADSRLYLQYLPIWWVGLLGNPVQLCVCVLCKWNICDCADWSLDAFWDLRSQVECNNLDLTDPDWEYMREIEIHLWWLVSKTKCTNEGLRPKSGGTICLIFLLFGLIQLSPLISTYKQKKTYTCAYALILKIFTVRMAKDWTKYNKKSLSCCM